MSCIKSNSKIVFMQERNMDLYSVFEQLNIQFRNFISNR